MHLVAKRLPFLPFKLRVWLLALLKVSKSTVSQGKKDQDLSGSIQRRPCRHEYLTSQATLKDCLLRVVQLHSKLVFKTTVMGAIGANS